MLGKLKFPKTVFKCRFRFFRKRPEKIFSCLSQPPNHQLLLISSLSLRHFWILPITLNHCHRLCYGFLARWKERFIIPFYELVSVLTKTKYCRNHQMNTQPCGCSAFVQIRCVLHQLPSMQHELKEVRVIFNLTPVIKSRCPATFR